MESALLRVNSDVLIGMDNGNYSGLVLLDLNSAFETVGNWILLNRSKEISFKCGFEVVYVISF